MSIANRREYLRQPIGRSPVADAIDRCFNTMPIGGPRSGILGAAGTGFSPADIASLAHWYDATEISGSDGDSIGTWTDQEGTDDLTQGTSSAKPTLRTSGINSKNVLEFDGTDDFLNTTFSAISQANQIFVVGKFRTTSTTDEVLFDSNASDNRHTISNSSGELFGIFAGTFLESNTTSTNSEIFNALFNGASSVLRLSGTEIASGDAGTDSLEGITVGAIAGGGSLFTPVDIGEAICYNANLSSSDESDVESYLSDKWGITI